MQPVQQPKPQETPRLRAADGQQLAVIDQRTLARHPAHGLRLQPRVSPQIRPADRSPGQQARTRKNAHTFAGCSQQAATVIVGTQPVQHDFFGTQAGAGTDLPGNGDHRRNGGIEHFRTGDAVHTSLTGGYDPARDQHTLERPALLLGQTIGDMSHLSQYGSGGRIASRVLDHRDLA
ncbi:hypothetical protein G6F22_014008 [Rhizopus arrhizus]|nr:hypothetical protein G6F22_014008 [Rhizopus arrhizus]